MTDAVHTARPPGSDEASTEYLKGTPEPAEAAEPDADSCELVGGDGSETAGPAERPGRRKGLPWTEAEHRDFLLGLQKLGKGDWRGISRHYVVTRTPTQVASHAQKHFIRQQTLSKRKRRASLFDITGEDDDAQLDAHGALHPQGGTTAAQPQAQRQQQAQQGQQAQPQQQQFMPPAMQQMPQFGGPMQGMPGFGYGHPMQQAAAAQAAAAAAAQGWNPNAGGPGFMGQQQQFQNYFQFAQQQQAAAGAMYLAQQQHQQQQAAMAAFMQHHGCGAGGFGPQGFGGQGFGFGAPGMVHMVPHYQQAMFSQPSVNASMQSAGTVQQPRHTQHTTTAVGDGQAMGNAGTDTAQRQPSQQLPQSQHLQPSPTLQLQQQQQQLLQAQQQQCNGGFASGNLPSGMGSNAGSWLGNGSVHGSNRGSRHGSSPDAEGDGSGEGNGSGDGSGDGSDTGAQPAVARQQSHKQDAAPVAPQPEPQQPPPEGHGDPAKAHTPFADVPQQNSGAFGGGRLYRPTASHARPSHSLSSLPLFAPDDAAAAAADADGNGTGNGTSADPQSPPAAVAAAPHNAPHSAFMRPHMAVKAEAHNENGGGSGNGSGSGNSTADGGRSRGSGDGSNNGSGSQAKNSQRSSGGHWGLVAAGAADGNMAAGTGADALARNAARVQQQGATAGGGNHDYQGGDSGSGASADGQQDQLAETLNPSPAKRQRLDSSPPGSAFEATPELAAAAQRRRE